MVPELVSVVGTVVEVSELVVESVVLVRVALAVESVVLVGVVSSIEPVLCSSVPAVVLPLVLVAGSGPGVQASARAQPVAMRPRAAAAVRGRVTMGRSRGGAWGCAGLYAGDLLDGDVADEGVTGA